MNEAAYGLRSLCVDRLSRHLRGGPEKKDGCNRVSEGKGVEERNCEDEDCKMASERPVFELKESLRRTATGRRTAHREL